jgi:hypothetical protein
MSESFHHHRSGDKKWVTERGGVPETMKDAEED